MTTVLTDAHARMEQDAHPQISAGQDDGTVSAAVAMPVTAVRGLGVMYGPSVLLNLLVVE